MRLVIEFAWVLVVVVVVVERDKEPTEDEKVAVDEELTFDVEEAYSLDGKTLHMDLVANEIVVVVEELTLDWKAFPQCSKDDERKEKMTFWISRFTTTDLNFE